MNYVVLNDQEYYKDICFEKGKEVLLDGRDRVDGVFGTITRELLDEARNDPEGGGRIFDQQWLCSNRGVKFVVIKFPQDLLYEESSLPLEECFGLFDPESFWVEVGAISNKNKGNRYEYFFVGYNKNSLYFRIIFNDGWIEKEEDEILKYVCQKIEERIL